MRMRWTLAPDSRIAAKYGGEASFQAYIAYFRATYMKRKRTYTATALCCHELC